jgi:F-type H+-transporting ATPase subunit c
MDLAVIETLAQAADPVKYGQGAGRAIALGVGGGLGAVGAGIGIGTIFGNYLQGALRNPSAAPSQFANLLLGFALAEATGLFGLVVSLILLFVV